MCLSLGQDLGGCPSALQIPEVTSVNMPRSCRVAGCGVGVDTGTHPSPCFSHDAHLRCSIQNSMRGPAEPCPGKDALPPTAGDVRQDAACGRMTSVLLWRSCRTRCVASASHPSSAIFLNSPTARAPNKQRRRHPTLRRFANAPTPPPTSRPHPLRHHGQHPPSSHQSRPLRSSTGPSRPQRDLDIPTQLATLRRHEWLLAMPFMSSTHPRSLRGRSRPMGISLAIPRLRLRACPGPQVSAW